MKKELGTDELERSRDNLSRVREELLKEVYVPLEPEDEKADKKEKEKDTITTKTAFEGKKNHS